jgi:hypothetical protein
MSNAQTAIGFDRLPWLEDEVEPPAKRRWRVLPALAAAVAMVLVAGAAYWIGLKSAPEPVFRPSPHARPSATLALPDAKPVEPEVQFEAPPQVSPVTPPAIGPAPQPELGAPRAERAQRPKGIHGKSAAADRTETKPVTVTKPSQQAAQTSEPLKLWPSRQSAGAAGRIVQIGAFGSRQQAKLGWRRMTQAYPAVGRLPAVVVTSRNSRGKLFYRFQIGTTSQAHSEVLCQRMEKIHFSCAVVGLPWKAKVER